AAVGGGEDVGLVHGVGAVPVGGVEGDGLDHDGGINFGEVVEAARVALAHVDVLAAGRVEDIRVRGAAGVRGGGGVHAAVGQGADEAIPIAAVREGVGQHAVVTQVEGIADQEPLWPADPAGRVAAIGRFVEPVKADDEASGVHGVDGNGDARPEPPVV